MNNTLGPTKRQLTNSVSEGLHFGTQTHTDFIPFTIKFLALALPGIVLGHYLDQGIYTLQKHKRLGPSFLTYLGIQIAAWIMMFYVMFRFTAAYAAEFQSSVAGIFFVALFFTVQQNFVSNLQAVLGMVDADLEKL